MKSRLAALFLDDDSRKDTTDNDTEGVSEETYTLLLVDDEPEVLNSLKRVFFQESYRILTADSAEEGLEILECTPAQVIISDHRMPGISGADFLGKIKERWPQTIRIMLTGYADISAVMGAINTGAVYKFITKPWNDEDLRITVSLAIEQYDLIKENKELRKQAKEKTEEIKKLARYAEINRSQFLNILDQQKKLNPEQKEKVKQAYNRTKNPYPHILTELGYLSDSEVVSILKSRLGVDRVYPKEFQPPDVLKFLFPEELCRRSHVFPLKAMDKSRVLLVMADPTDLSLIDDLRFLTGMDIVAAYAPMPEIDELIGSQFKEGESELADLAQINEYDPYETIEIVVEEEDESLEELIKSSETPPAIKLVNVIILEALKSRASDIHLERRVKSSLVRFRVDGLLQDHIQIPVHLHQALVSRIKVMAELDISERRRPQDGRVTVRSALRTVDLRISILPTLSGEKVVMRVLERDAMVRRVSELGAEPDDIERMISMIQTPQGMILATGPTGTGKTTTLYTLLNEHADPSINYVTIEDPVEYFLEYAEQVLVKEKIGLDFATILRAILRQDPNVILLGEIRDYKTAEVAFHASLTGHLVLSTIHTTSTVGTVARLLDLGVKPYIIASGLSGIISQRLVRRLCPHCREEVNPDPKILEYLGVGSAKLNWGAKGCSQCHQTGFSGRMGLYEIFKMTPEVRKLIAKSVSENELSRLVRQQGMRTLLESGLNKVQAGLTSLEEILRVLGPCESHSRICSRCAGMTDESELFCPFCGQFLMQACPKCESTVEEHWTFCARCGHPLSSAVGTPEEKGTDIELNPDFPRESFPSRLLNSRRS